MLSASLLAMYLTVITELIHLLYTAAVELLYIADKTFRDKQAQINICCLRNLGKNPATRSGGNGRCYGDRTVVCG